MDEGAAYVWDSREEVSNNGGPSEGYLSSGKDVPYKGCSYHEEEEDNTNVSCLFVKVGTIVKASTDVEIDANEKERGSVGMEVADEPTVVYVSTNVSDRRKGCSDV